MTDFARYRLIHQRLISGWIDSPILLVLQTLNAEQRRLAVKGGVAEIGVHHGRLFVGLELLRDAAESSVAIDVFDDQDLNVDKSGRGNLASFQRNLRLHSPNSGSVTVIQSDSTKLDAATLAAHGPFRIFDVDGGHMPNVVASDMRLAAATASDGGIIMGDDIFNPLWPGAMDGTVQWLQSQSDCTPFAICFNKVLFSNMYAAEYQAALRSLAHRRHWTVAEREFFGSTVVVLKTGSPLRRVVRLSRAYARGRLISNRRR